MISVENITKGFGDEILLKGITFRVNSREKIGLVGRNGHGKTTLIRMITGEEKPDSGSIIKPKNYRIASVSQHIDFTEDTVMKEGVKGLPENEKDHYWKVEKILSGLGFTENDMKRHPEEFSGGYQVRLNLAKVLVSDPDLLLLDEPTNYLDITSIRWIQNFLKKWPHELILITHDRSFIDNVVTHIVGIHRKDIRKIPGETGKYYSQIALDEEVYEKTRLNEERRRKDMDLFINRFRAKARLANMVQSRIKTLNKLDNKEKLEAISNLDFSFRNKPYSGKYSMKVQDLSFSYEPEKPLIQDMNITVGAHDRICVIGKNGKGKTTLLKLLAGVLKPQKGEVVYNPGIVKGFFEQTNVKTLVDSRTILEEILYSDSGVDQQMSRNISGAMMFEGDNALKKIKVLSGGEKSRVMLGKLLVTPVNLLILDEPTNHLDMDSCDALLAAIDNFDGTVIMVTHNEMFLHALAQRLIVFQNDKTFIFEGNYQYFLEKQGWNEEEAKRKPFQSEPDKKVSGEKFSKKKLRKKRSAIISEKSKVLNPIKKRIEKIENNIENNEIKLEHLNNEIEEASKLQDSKKIVSLSQEIHNSHSEIEKLFEELDILTTKFEEQDKIYKKDLEILEKMDNT